MTTPEDQPAVGRRRVRPYAMTGGRTRPAHTELEVEALVLTTSQGERSPKLTVEQRAIAASPSPRSRPASTCPWA